MQQGLFKNTEQPTPPASGAQVQRLVSHSFTDAELQAMGPPVPYEVQVRMALNLAGFKFKDDGKPSLITNRKPEPLGIMTCRRDEATATTNYKQKMLVG